MEKKKLKLKLLVCALAIGLSVSLANADIETDLVAYWPFEEGSGTTTADATGHGHNGTFTGAPTWDNGPEGFGGALSFVVGTSEDGVCCGTALDPGNVFTLAIWANWNGNDAVGNNSLHFMTKSDGWNATTMRWQWELFAKHSDPARTDKIGISCYGPGSIMLSADTMPVNEWVHLTITYDGTNATLFINGVMDTMGPQTFSIGTGTNAEFFIGRACRNNVNRSFAGELDEARVYSRVLSVDDIQALASPDPDYNFAPSVDAGSYQSLLWQAPSVTVQLDATATDDGKPYQDPPADPCTPIGLTLTWSKVSGPGNVTFSPGNDIKYPTATFTAAGFYELRLCGYDGEKDACDVVEIYVRANNDPIAYWDFDGGSDPVNDDSANNNVGTRAGDSEPNWVDGWVSGGKALEFFGVGASTTSSYVKITTDPAAADPNLDNIQREISLSAWIKVGNLENSFYPAIIANGNNTWRMGLATDTDNFGQVWLACNGLTGASVYTTSTVNDGYWHHIAGIYDGSTAYVYIDGVLDTSAERTGLINVNDMPVTIGCRATSATAVERSFNGLIDDVRVYGYGLSTDQIAALADMAPLVPVVDAGDDQTFSMQEGYVQLDGTVTDDGKPVAATIEWSKTSGPGDVVFSDTAIEDPCVTFSEIGTYILRLTADDTMAVVYDEVEIKVENPTCQDVINDGLLISSDFSGPEGTPDCRVDLYDFAAFAGNWLRCNNPQDGDCEFPY